MVADNQNAAGNDATMYDSFNDIVRGDVINGFVVEKNTLAKSESGRIKASNPETKETVDVRHVADGLHDKVFAATYRPGETDSEKASEQVRAEGATRGVEMAFNWFMDAIEGDEDE